MISADWSQNALEAACGLDKHSNGTVHLGNFRTWSSNDDGGGPTDKAFYKLPRR